jgi:hypothetical protein
MPFSAEAIIAIFGVIVTVPPTLTLLYRRQQRNASQKDHTGMMQLFTESIRLLTINNVALVPTYTRPMNSRDMLLWRREEIISWYSSLPEAGLVDNIHSFTR